MINGTGYLSPAYCSSYIPEIFTPVIRALDPEHMPVAHRDNSLITYMLIAIPFPFQKVHRAPKLLIL